MLGYLLIAFGWEAGNMGVVDVLVVRSQVRVLILLSGCACEAGRVRIDGQTEKPKFVTMAGDVRVEVVPSMLASEPNAAKGGLNSWTGG